MICSKCNEPSIVSARYFGKTLCQTHFIEDFENRVSKTIAKNAMFEDGERIAVAVSGGKDSTALLLCLDKILAGRNVELVAVTVDEGISGYRDDTITSAKSVSARLGIHQEIISFRDEYGHDLDEMVKGKEVAPCTFCGVFRKSALNRIAKRLGATKVATGHNLDDEVQSIMMNYLKGDIERLMRFRPRKAQVGLVPRAKPLREIPEKEIALYCMVNGIFTQSRECPYASLSLRSDVRDMMNRFENLIPGTKQSSLRGFEKIGMAMLGQKSDFNLNSCKICGEPCVKSICKACELCKAFEK